MLSYILFVSNTLLAYDGFMDVIPSPGDLNISFVIIGCVPA